MTDAIRRRLGSEGAAARCSHLLGPALVSLLLVACAGCNSVRIGGTGIALPPGDVERGKAAFRDLQCYVCHSVSGHDFPQPYIQPPILMVLGTEDRAPSRRELIDSIINPSHKIHPGIDLKLVQTNRVSRMSDFSDVMTVRQLCDLVAFLETLHR